MRQTKQRDAIQRAIDEAAGPLSPDELHRAALEHFEGLGIATVYRELKRLTAAGELQTVVLPDGVTRYEKASLPHHHHFACHGCETTFDIDFCPKIPRGTELDGGFVVESHDLTLYGLCPSCRG